MVQHFPVPEPLAVHGSVVSFLHSLIGSDPHGHGDGATHGAHWHEHNFGLSLPMYAFVFATISGISLPIGAWMGIKLSPVKEETCAAMMSFGAGCLLFAVTVELYAHALRELHKARVGPIEMVVMVCGALGGAYFYVYINHVLEHAFGDDSEDVEKSEEDIESPQKLKDAEKQQRRAPSEGGPLLDAPAQSSYGSQRTSASPMSKEKSPSRRTSAQEQRHGAPIMSALSTVNREKEARNKAEARKRAQARWRKVRMWVKMRSATGFWQQKTMELKGIRGREKAMRMLASSVQQKQAVNQPIGAEKELESQSSGIPDEATIKKAKQVAMALFLGLLVDGVPEGVLMGFLAAEGHLTPVLIISLLVANFPEAFSSSSLLVTGQIPVAHIIGMWTGLCVLVGGLAGFACWALLATYPGYGHGMELPLPVLIGISLVEGVTGGAMIACIAAVMLPEAVERTNKDGPLWMSTGFLCTGGFLAAVCMKALGG